MSRKRWGKDQLLPSRKSSRLVKVEQVDYFDDDHDESTDEDDILPPSKRKRSEVELAQYVKTDDELEQLLEIQKDNPSLSAYECRRKLNIIKNEKLLKGLGIQEIKQSVAVEPIKRVPKKRPPRIPATPDELLLCRKSSRSLTSKPVEYSDDINEREHDDVISDDDEWLEGVRIVNQFFKGVRAKLFKTEKRHKKGTKI